MSLPVNRNRELTKSQDIAVRDAAPFGPGKQNAAEMQLQLKSRDRALTTLQKVTADYDGVWLFAKPGAVSDAFERAMSELSPELKAKVRMLPLESDYS